MEEYSTLGRYLQDGEGKEEESWETTVESEEGEEEGEAEEDHGE